ncbi:MAG: hypothetical protein WD380_11175 [Gaiellaceae bacterium]
MEQVSAGEPLFAEGRRLYTEEINAGVRGAPKQRARPRSSSRTGKDRQGLNVQLLVPKALDPDCEHVVQDEWIGDTGTAPLKSPFFGR